MLERNAFENFKLTTCTHNGFLRLVVSPLYEVVSVVSFSYFDSAGQTIVI